MRTMRRAHRAPEPVEPQSEQDASRRGDRESAPDNSKIAEKRNRPYDDGNRCYCAPDQAIEPLHGEGLVILSIIPVSGGRDTMPIHWD